METMFPPLTATRFEAATSAVSAAVYLLVALAALVRAPRDARTGLFLLVAIVGGSLALFHFLQIFPWPLPWIRRYFELLLTGYGLVPLIVLGLIWFAPAQPEQIDASYAVLTLFIGLPAVFIIGIVLPLADCY